MLKNYGFQVIDLGKDVPKETIVRAARENHASIIGLSALMTTTMQEMRHVIEPVSYTHLDVYKRQFPQRKRILKILQEI